VAERADDAGLLPRGGAEGIGILLLEVRIDSPWPEAARRSDAGKQGAKAWGSREARVPLESGGRRTAPGRPEALLVGPGCLP
jgi:hypothetical protein